MGGNCTDGLKIVGSGDFGIPYGLVPKLPVVGGGGKDTAGGGAGWLKAVWVPKLPAVGGGGRFATGGSGLKVVGGRFATGGATGWLKDNGLKKFTAGGGTTGTSGSCLNTLNGWLSLNRAGSLRFELGRGGGERTFSVDLDRLSRTVLASSGGSIGAANSWVALSEDCGRELAIPVSGVGGCGC